MKIRIVDELNPEDVAMLQALYSRSAQSVDTHIEKVKATGSGKFMSQFYVGYGHKSIADCGSTTIFIEGVSLLAAKAIQDWPLYSGQETSTRYVDMGSAKIIDPINTPESRAILDCWMNFYTRNLDRVFHTVKERHPIREGEAWGTYEKAAKARVFDIMRGFLPAGITTQLSWHTNLRQASDHLAWLRVHPLAEVRDIASSMRAELHQRYPSSGFSKTVAGVAGIANNDPSHTAEQHAWMKQFAELMQAYPGFEASKSGGVWLHGAPPIAHFAAYRALMAERPRGCVLPHFMSDLGQFHFDMTLDFGSFRDLQRHRNGVVRMPMLKTGWFEHWYLQQLDEALRDEAKDLITEQQRAINALPCSDVERQNYISLGFQVGCSVTMGLPALVYFMELRSQKTVHPTLRKRVLELVERFEQQHSQIKIHVDRDPDDWTVRRGEQTITAKEPT